MEQIAFFGLGRMGRVMALRLLERGYQLSVYNRTQNKAAQIAHMGAHVCEDPTAAVKGARILITMLADDSAVFDLTDEKVLTPLGKNDGIHLSMSTISPEAARELAAIHEKMGVQYLACPVFGRPDAASAGKLWLCLAGPDEAKREVRPVLDALGQGVFDCGPRPEDANIIKIAGNLMIAAAIEVMAEAFSLTEKNGVAPQLFHEILANTLFNCPVYVNYGKAILEGHVSPAGFPLELGLKDVQIIRDTARKSRVPMPVASILEDRLLRSMACNRGNLDWTAIALDQREAAGLKG